jgi:hypothetical protein
MLKGKKAAMELTMGTMVTIVLLVMVLILGGYFVQKIFFSAGSSLDAIDESVKGEISKLFSEDNTKRLVIFPASRRIELEKGQSESGFAISIRNVGNAEDTFSYTIEAVETSCQELSVTAATGMISLNRQRQGIRIPAGSIMSEPFLVTFNIPETAPPCQVTYSINIENSAGIYISSVDVAYLTILSD